MKKAQVYAKHKHARVSPKKTAIVMDLIRGKKLEESKKQLAFDQTKAASMILKVVQSAEANAVNNHGLKSEELFISEIYVTPGRIQRGGRAGAKGRFDPLRKRYSHIIVGLSQLNKNKDEDKAKKTKKTKKKKVKKEEK